MTTTAFFIPHSLEEALSLRREHGPDLVVMGGGTIVMGMINDGLLFPGAVMSLRRAGLDGVHRVNSHLEIGATTTVAQLSTLETFPILAQAARMIGGPAIRNMATLGGNLLAQQPASDTAVPLLVLDAHVEVADSSGGQTLPLNDFLAGHERADDQLIVAVHVPASQGRTAYMRFGRREANTPSVIAVAVRLVIGSDGMCREARVALGAAGPYAFRSRGAESALEGQIVDDAAIAAAAEAAMAESDPFTDALASAWYRRKMVGVYVRRTLEQALKAS